jgi:hypothetical protein
MHRKVDDEENRYNVQYWYGTTKKKRLYHVSGKSLLIILMHAKEKGY